MSEFTLPPNSKVGEGKHWALAPPANLVKLQDIVGIRRRRNPDDGYS